MRKNFVLACYFLSPVCPLSSPALLPGIPSSLWLPDGYNYSKHVLDSSNFKLCNFSNNNCLFHSQLSACFSDTGSLQHSNLILTLLPVVYSALFIQALAFQSIKENELIDETTTCFPLLLIPKLYLLF